MNTIRILLADDHPVLRSGLKALIESQPDMKIVGEAADGNTAVEFALTLDTDVILMDISMPGLGGTEATVKIKQSHPEKKILVLTAHEDPAYLRALLNAGASGYILKRAAAEDLIRAIRTVAQGSNYIDPSMAGQLVSAFNTQTVARSEGVLSERESEVLKFVSQGHALKSIASQLDVGVRTIETYKSRGMEKLGLKTRSDLVRYASQQGWLKADDAAV